MKLYLDLETIPGQQPWVRADVFEQIEKDILELRPPGNYKKQESIDAWRDAEAARLRDGGEEKYRRTALDGGRGEIVSIALAVDEKPARVFIRGPEASWPSELEIIAEFFDTLGDILGEQGAWGCVWIGHNIAKFDLPFLWQRCVALGYRPPVALPKHPGPKAPEVYDTMTAWAGWGGRISQDRLCKILQLPPKEGMTGADVYRVWLDGDIDMLAEYNASDVEKVRQIYKKLEFKK